MYNSDSERELIQSGRLLLMTSQTTAPPSTQPPVMIRYERMTTFKTIHVKTTVVHRKFVEHDGKTRAEEISDVQSEECVRSTTKRRYTPYKPYSEEEMRYSEKMFDDSFLSVSEHEDDDESTQQKAASSMGKNKMTQQKSINDA